MPLPSHTAAHTHITRVRIADDTPLPVSSIGHLTTRSFSVPSVSHVPHLSMSLMFVSQLTDFDCQVIFDRTSCRVQDRSGAVIGVGRRHSGVYVLESLFLPSPSALGSHCYVPSPSASVSHCHADVLPYHQWHHRLGHLCPSRLSTLVNRDSLGVVSPKTNVVCCSCKLGKQLQLPYL